MIALLLTIAAAAQPASSLDQRRLTVLQFEVKLPARLSAPERRAARAIFHADTRTIRTCPDAIRIAGRYKAQRKFTGTITTRSDVAFASLPAPIRAELARTPIGRATRVYGPQDSARVLIACTAPALPRTMAPGKMATSPVI